MGLLDTLREQFAGLPTGMSRAHQQRLNAWKRRSPADLALNHQVTRYVIVDVESSGLNAEFDDPISVAAVSVSGGLIDPNDVFEVVIRQEQVSTAKNILEHGIGASAQRQGVPPADALLMFLEFVGGSPVIAYNAFLDQAMIDRVTLFALGIRPALNWIDLAKVLPEIFPAHADKISGFESWLDVFMIPASKRRSLILDCYTTAQLLQMALRRATAMGKGSPASLIRLDESRRWLRHK